ncbi:MAG: prepilin-type N-terminal cleavage/methylation domain-containing protein [Candidatus Omnitrophica bacterium]|nr:prepilin-type N-terminal cleavage/methylation domain-containing protein [Candidatus Omnitrophota bacterium]MCF7877249.1 prepilin-type N-terminal cleavage/methylation domain-containing protein [Candidatus Omnitrophota bacterium]MCF7893319.1 prepilin-type N-terminal cleavage/methylation domain-containing protein [Candidatus Omnitrophota bacterium]
MHKKSFTLVELLVAVGILMILLLLVIPNLWRARVNSNESVAVSNLKSLNSSLQMYYLDNDSFPDNLTDLIFPASDPSYVNPELTDGTEAGYNFSYTQDSQDSFHITASPRRVGTTGKRYFYLDDSGDIHYNSESQASSSDPILK